MAEGKLKVYSDEEVQARIQADGLEAWTLEDGWLRRKYNTDGWPTTLMLVNADRLPLRGGVSSRGPVGNLGQALGQTQNSFRRGDHRQGLRPCSQDRGSRPLAPRARQSFGRNAQQVCSDQEVNIGKASINSKGLAHV